MLLNKGLIGERSIARSEGYIGQYILVKLQDQVCLFLRVLLPGVREKLWAATAYLGHVVLPFTALFSEGR